MILKEENGLRILAPKNERYLIHMKSSNTYHDMIILPKDATLENFEDVEKTEIEGIDCTNILIEQLEEMVIELAIEIAKLKQER